MRGTVTRGLTLQILVALSKKVVAESDRAQVREVEEKVHLLETTVERRFREMVHVIRGVGDKAMSLEYLQQQQPPPPEVHHHEAIDEYAVVAVATVTCRSGGTLTRRFLELEARVDDLEMALKSAGGGGGLDMSDVEHLIAPVRDQLPVMQGVLAKLQKVTVGLFRESHESYRIL